MTLIKIVRTGILCSSLALSGCCFNPLYLPLRYEAMKTTKGRQASYYYSDIMSYGGMKTVSITDFNGNGVFDENDRYESAKYGSKIKTRICTADETPEKETRKIQKEFEKIKQLVSKEKIKSCSDK